MLGDSLSDSQVVSSYMTNKKQDQPVLSVHKLVSAYRHDVGSRFSFKQSEEAHQVRPVGAIKGIEDKRTRSIVPQDRRKYRDSII